MIKAPDIEKTLCAHCGDICPGQHPRDEENHFCCNACKMVYLLLQENNLGSYYDIEKMPGIKSRQPGGFDFAFLENEDIQSELIAFSSGSIKTIFVELPDIHCSACIWLLEHLPQLNAGIVQCRVNFLQKKATIIFDGDKIALSALFDLLAKIGYPPQINLAGKNSVTPAHQDKGLLMKIGVAGFCFGNIMLLSFPDYLGDTQHSFFQHIGYINIALSLPVLLFSAQDYFRSAWRSLQAGILGIDIPIVIGMLTLFLRSVYEIVMQTGVSYLDSFSGFVFFLLIGRWYQKYSYEHISFDRDYRSFLPLAVKRKRDSHWEDTRIQSLKKGDIILIRSGDIIPCDGTLIKGKAAIDYSFITGESQTVHIPVGSAINAGGKQTGAALEIIVEELIEESSLTELWKNDIFAHDKSPASVVLLNKIGQYFTITIIMVALGTLLFWLNRDPHIAFNAFTAVLIIACPCVLALSFPFLYGNALRLLTQKGIFVKNLNALYQLAQLDTIVFDKTGTLTDSEKITAQYEGKNLSRQQKICIKSSCSYSHHPLSQAIFQFFSDDNTIIPDHFEELPGQGISAQCGSILIRLGSAAFILGSDSLSDQQQSLLEIDGQYMGCFNFESPLRDGLKENISVLGQQYNLAVISGDNPRDAKRLQSLFGLSAKFRFRQTPEDKLSFVKKLQLEGHKVMMIGDGLNDAGALRQSDVSAVIAKDHHFFTPASDIILNSRAFAFLPQFLKYMKWLRKSLYGAFLMALIYNGLGLLFAVSGKLTPIVAAILMPASSLSIVAYGIGVSFFFFQRNLRHS